MGNGTPCDSGKKCEINGKCQGGVCKADPVEVTAINGACVAARAVATTFTATSNAPAKVEWTAPGGTPATGTGGSFGVSFAAEGAKVVTAACTPSSKTKSIEVGPPCAGVTATVQRTQTASAPGGFGVVVPGTVLKGKYKGCVDGSKWCFRLEELQETYGYGISAHGRIDVPSAASAVVTPTSCTTIIADLTPPAAGTGFGPPRGTYWVQAATVSHEQQHINNTLNLVLTPTMNDLSTYVSNASRCTDCKSAAQQAAWDAQARTYFTTHMRPLLVPSGGSIVEEVRAHNFSNPQYTTLINAIRARANAAPPAAGWPAACK